MNLATAIPKVKLIYSMGSYAAVVLRQPIDLGHTLTFVGEQIGDQLLSSFLEPTNGGALVAFQVAEVKVTLQATIIEAPTPNPMLLCSCLATPGAMQSNICTSI